VLSDRAVPAIYRLEDGKVVAAESEFTLNERALVEWAGAK